jgi:hypothetical protein
MPPTVQNSPVPGGPIVARCPVGPIVHHAPQCPTDRLAPLLLRFTRKQGISEKRRLNRSGIAHTRLTFVVPALRSAAVECSAVTPSAAMPWSSGDYFAERFWRRGRDPMS